MMSKLKADKIHQQLKTIVENDGDHCTICNKEFPRKSFVYGGLTSGGAIELVGECCRHRLKEVFVGSIYI